MTTTPTPSPDAVEALARAVWPHSTEAGLAIPSDLKYATEGVMKRILDAGFTITRAAPMSEAELELRAGVISYYTSQADEIVQLAKKYRG